MKISRIGRDYIKKNGRIGLVRDMEDIRMETVMDEKDFLYFVAFIGAYYIQKAATDEESQEELFCNFSNMVKSNLIRFRDSHNTFKVEIVKTPKP